MAAPNASTTPPSKTLGEKQVGVSYTNRLAVRAVLVDDTNDRVALIYIAVGNYFKLPGGGIEAGEDHKIAVERELLEETGCKPTFESMRLLATSEEWRNDLHQTSFCYVTSLKEDTGKTQLTEEEAAEGLKHDWVAVQDAMEKMRNIQPTSELGEYIKKRDLFFMESFASERGLPA
jgi:ADP-ribose pyrophosphatase YjhB (NUDIX family)